MSWLISLAGLALKFWSWLTGREEIQAGERDQQLADLKGDLNDAEQSNKISAALGSLDDQQLDQRLRDQQSDIQRLRID